MYPVFLKFGPTTQAKTFLSFNCTVIKDQSRSPILYL